MNGKIAERSSCLVMDAENPAKGANVHHSNQGLDLCKVVKSEKKSARLAKLELDTTVSAINR